MSEYIEQIQADNGNFDVYDKAAVHTETDPVFSASAAAGILPADIEAWNNKEDKSNKTTSVNKSSTDAQYPSAKAVYSAIAALPTPMQFKGSLGTGGTITSLPTASASNNGYTYKVITAGTYAGQSAKVGDVFISNGSSWVLVPSGDEPSGTVTNIATGTGLTGGPITTNGTIAVDTNTIATRTYAASVGPAPTSSQITTALGYTPYSSSNPNGYTSNTGTVTNIVAGNGLSTADGNPITTNGTISIDTNIVATKTDINNIRQVSTGGTTGQVLTRDSSGGYGWTTISASLTQDDYLSAQEMEDIMGEDTFWNGEMV